MYPDRFYNFVDLDKCKIIIADIRAAVISTLRSNCHAVMLSQRCYQSIRQISTRVWRNAVDIPNANILAIFAE